MTNVKQALDYYNYIKHLKQVLINIIIILVKL